MNNEADITIREKVSWDRLLDSKSNVLISLYLYVAKSYSKLGRNEDAIQFSKKALENENNSPFIHMQCLWVQSDIYYESGHFNECKESVEEIWRILDSHKNINELLISVAQTPN